MNGALKLNNMEGDIKDENRKLKSVTFLLNEIELW